MRTRPATLAAAVLAALSLGVPWQASAACNASIQSIEPVPTIVYDPFDNDTETEDFKVTIRNNGNDDCTLTLAVAGSAAGSQRYYTNGLSQLAYQAETPDDIPYPNNIAVPLGTTSLQGGNGREKDIKVQLRVRAGLIARAVGTLTAGRSPANGAGIRNSPTSAEPRSCSVPRPW
jgi:hypothetical protein